MAYLGFAALLLSDAAVFEGLAKSSMIVAALIFQVLHHPMDW